MIRILVGSPSILKVEAAHAALDRIRTEAEIIGVACDSGVPPQPYGREQTLEGATNRAEAARKIDPTAYAVGIENGLVPCAGVVHDVAYVLVITPSGRCIMRESAGVSVPREMVEASLASKQTLTAGALEARRSGGSPSDPHKIWSGGLTDRKLILTEALYTALSEAITTEEGEIR